jgi:hypothetical protein
MTSKVRVTADDNGNIIAVSQNPEYGYIRIEQDVCEFSVDGWLRMRTRSALVHGLMTDLQDANFTKGQELPGKIVVRESHMPFDLGNPDRNLKLAGETGVVCRVGDQPIYRQTFYTQDPTAYDEFIQHDNKQEIREVMEASKMLHQFSLPTEQAVVNL